MANKAIIDGDWHFLVRRAPYSRRLWIAFAKREPFTHEGHALHEQGEMWFELGKSEEDALQRVRAEVEKESADGE
jgi:hypothetical protein